MDTIVSAFGHSVEARLPQLDDESKAIKKILRTIKHQFLHMQEQYAERDELSATIRDVRQELVVFLYSGHAGSNMILIEDEEADAEGLLELLKQCPRLRLVVLNGCNTVAQVSALHEAGIPAVIATGSPVDDLEATRFSTEFFKYLCEMNSVQRSFELAKSALWSGAEPKMELHRGLGGEWGSDKHAKADLWGLYVAEGQDSILDWTLGHKTSAPEHEDFVPNLTLFRTILRAVKPYRQKAEELCLMLDDEDDDLDEFEIKDTVLACMPGPISDELRKLISVGDEDGSSGNFYDKPGLTRLKQLGLIYNLVAEIIAITFLGQLWDAAETSEVVLNEDEKRILQDYLIRGGEDGYHYKFSKLIGMIRRLLTRIDIEYFITQAKHLSEVYENEEVIKDAVTFFEDLIPKIDSITEGEGVSLSIEAEQHIDHLFSELGFLSNYNLTSIKSIDVQKYRHMREPSYKYKFVRFVRGFDGGGFGSRGKFERSFVMDKESVCITRYGVEEEAFMTLTPFLIDENAFDPKATLNNLRFFRNYDPGSDVVYYKLASGKRLGILEVSEVKMYRKLREQLDRFSELFLGKPLNEL